VEWRFQWLTRAANSLNSGITLPSLGQVTTPDPYHELETKYSFGFTDGADIGAEGEKAIEFETTTASGLRGGTYATLEQEVENFSHQQGNLKFEVEF